MTNAHGKTGQMAVCCQNLMLGMFSIHSVLSVLVGALFKKFGLFLNMPCTIYEHMFRQNPQLQPSNVTLPLLNVS
jgi:hypothetical protein